MTIVVMVRLVGRVVNSKKSLAKGIRWAEIKTAMMAVRRAVRRRLRGLEIQ